MYASLRLTECVARALAEISRPSKCDDQHQHTIHTHMRVVHPTRNRNVHNVHARTRFVWLGGEMCVHVRAGQ